MRAKYASSVLAVGALAALASSPAHAAPSLTLASIVEATVPPMLHPKDAPESIPEHEKVEGLSLSGGGTAMHRPFLNVIGDLGRCVTLGAIPPGAARSGVANAHIRVGSSAMPLRVERFVEHPTGGAQLEITDAWLDGKTRGVRHVKTTRIGLTPIAKGPAGYVVFAMREGNVIDVVLPSKNMLGYVDERGRTGMSQCGHVRLSLDTSAAEGAMILAAGRIQTPSPAAARRASPSLINMPQQRAMNPSAFEMRGIEVSVSASRTKRNPAPLLSASVSWAEDEMPSTNVDVGDDFEFDGRNMIDEDFAVPAVPADDIDEE